jgi:hypothetical protein
MDPAEAEFQSEAEAMAEPEGIPEPEAIPKAMVKPELQIMPEPEVKPAPEVMAKSDVNPAEVTDLLKFQNRINKARKRLSVSQDVKLPHHTTISDHVDHILKRALDVVQALGEVENNPHLKGYPVSLPDTYSTLDCTNIN